MSNMKNQIIHFVAVKIMIRFQGITKVLQKDTNTSTSPFFPFETFDKKKKKKIQVIFLSIQVFDYKIDIL